MYYYHSRLRVILLSLGVLFGYGSAIAHVAWHRHHHDGHGYGYGMHGCFDGGDWFDDAPWWRPAEPAPNKSRDGTSAPKPVQ